MARNINDIFNFIDYLVRKQRGVFVKIEDAMSALDAAQLDKLEDDFSLYGINQKIHDSIRPFRVYQPFTSASDGTVTYQSDYLHIVGSPYLVYGSTVTPITFILEDEFVSTLTNQLRPVNAGNPIARDISNGFVIYPQQVQVGGYTYIKRPATPVLSYTQVGRVITYIPSTSVQLQWSDIYINNIIARALKYLGLNMAEQDISAFAEKYTNETI